MTDPSAPEWAVVLAILGVQVCAVTMVVLIVLAVLRQVKARQQRRLL